MGLSLPVLAIIGRLFVTRYGALRGSSTPAKRRRFRIAFPPILSRIPIRLPGRLPAMIWLELRQSMPLAACGLSPGSSHGDRKRTARASARLFVRHHPCSWTLPSSMFIVAMLWAVVVGSGLYSADLGSGLGAFWRSRPISPDLWFWTKFVVGLAAVVGVLDGVTILVSWKSPRAEMTTGMSWAYVGCFPIIHALMYALAVLGTCWFRRPVIGGILAILGYNRADRRDHDFPDDQPAGTNQRLQRPARRGTLRASRFHAAWISACLWCPCGLDCPARAPLIPIGQTTSANIPLVRATNGITSRQRRISSGSWKRSRSCPCEAIASARQPIVPFDQIRQRPPLRASLGRRRGASEQGELAIARPPGLRVPPVSPNRVFSSPNRDTMAEVATVSCGGTS